MLIKTLRKQRKLSQSDVANALGLRSYQAVQKWERGLNPVPELYFDDLAKLLGVSVSVFSEARPSAKVKPGLSFFLDEPIEGHSTNTRTIQPNIKELYRQLPYATLKAQAGIPESYEGCQLDWINETYPVYIRDYVANKKELVIEIDGDSMTPGIVDGARVLAESVSKDDIKYESGGIYAVLFGNGRFVVKRIKTNTINTDGVLRLWSDNETYGHIDIPANEIHCMWKVVGKVWEPMK
ncbi:XRE family transcriptional regulator [Spirosoma endophyticum]|uniref:Peptidase S24-like n=1 Tax=Spirosoma endophyticum TaxID=662367 RepID=A0A1I1SN01_9BACT|nr:XRE family transcriptional regulator [Spirosoma endophyticum]SFD47859.1 Peptidase S24-like [Spirosoma endophyticum]